MPTLSRLLFIFYQSLDPPNIRVKHEHTLLNNISLLWYFVYFLGFSMNGESMASKNGFQQITIHYKTNHHLTINTNSINYNDGQNNVQYLWGQEPTQHNQEG